MSKTRTLTRGVDKPKVAKRKIPAPQKGTPEYERWQKVVNFDQRQRHAFELFSDTQSETYNNAYKSALKAGYTQKYAENVTLQDWWQEELFKLSTMLPQAEAVISRTLHETPYVRRQIGKGKKAFFIEEYSESKERIIGEMAKFVAKTVGRKRYHEKHEVDVNVNLSLTAKNPMLHATLIGENTYDANQENTSTG